jgi:hypothetical protein
MRQQKREDEFRQALIEVMEEPEREGLVRGPLTVVAGHKTPLFIGNVIINPLTGINTGRNCNGESAVNAAMGLHPL